MADTPLVRGVFSESCAAFRDMAAIASKAVAWRGYEGEECEGENGGRGMDAGKAGEGIYAGRSRSMIAYNRRARYTLAYVHTDPNRCAV